MTAFGVSATSSAAGTGQYDYMRNVKVTKDADGGLWSPEGQWYWPMYAMTYYAWSPYEAENLNIEYVEGEFPHMNYEIPEDVSKQVPLFFEWYTHVGLGNKDPIPLTFRPVNTAIRFVVGDDLAACNIKSVSIRGVKYKGYHLMSSANGLKNWSNWILEDETKDFSLTLNKDLTGTAGEAITAEDQTFFMMPQIFPDDASIEIVVSDGVADFVLSANLKNGSSIAYWNGGVTYTYRISHNFDALSVSNEEFVAYTDDALTKQLAFFVKGTNTSSGATGTITAPTGVTVTPTTFTANGSVVPVYVTWPAGVTADKISIALGSVQKEVSLSRETPAEDGPFWIYSVTETASQPVGSDVLALENASQDKWIGMTASANYAIGNAYTQDTYYNPQKGDFYLLTIGATNVDRFASLLATKAAGNVMYCVQQKAITADFGFKNCARNISRESEKWNIVLSGGRFKNQSTSLEAKLVISDDVSAGLINSLGRDLTYGYPVTVEIDKTTAKGVSIQKYVKKCWDTGANNTSNNGTRKVNVKIQDGSLDWYDVAGTGIMADRDTWGNTYMLGRGEYHATSNDNKYAKVVRPIFSQYSEVHANHPFFGVGAVSKNWACFGDNNSTNKMENPMYRVYCAVRSINGEGTQTLYNHNVAGWAAYMMIQFNTYQDFIANRTYSQNNQLAGIFAPYNQAFYADGYRAWHSWNDNTVSCAVIPTIYKSRPTNAAPITGTSVNE